MQAKRAPQGTLVSVVSLYARPTRASTVQRGCSVGAAWGCSVRSESQAQPMYFTSHRLMAGNSNSTSVRTVSLIKKGITPL